MFCVGNAVLYYESVEDWWYLFYPTVAYKRLDIYSVIQGGTGRSVLQRMCSHLAVISNLSGCNERFVRSALAAYAGFEPLC